MTRILRGRLLSFKGSPRRAGAAAYRYIEDGALRIEAGKIVEVGEAGDMLARAPAEAVIGASTEAADNTFDLFVAIPSAGTQTDASLNGAFYAADLELSPLRDSLVTLSLNGAGSVTAVSATGHSTGVFSDNYNKIPTSMRLTMDS